MDQVLKAREEAVRQLLRSLGEDPDREGLQNTPSRVALMYDELFSGYRMDPLELLSTTFAESHQELVLVRDIRFYSHCEHHMVPFFGVAHIAYIPKGRVVGLSKLVRLVECFARRLQIQERMTSQIADTIDLGLNPYGIAVVIEAEHMCMVMRGVQKPGVVTATSAVRGIFKEDDKARAELMALIRR